MRRWFSSRGLSRPSPLRSAGRAGRGAGRAGLFPRLPPPLRRSRRRARALPRPVRAHARVRGHRQRRDPRAVRRLPALDALLVAERVPADRAGLAGLRARARRLRRGGAAEAAVRAAARLRVGQRPDRRPRPLRPAHARLPRRRALHRARRLRAAAARLAAAQGRPHGPDRRRGRRRAPAAARDHAQPGARLPAARLHRRRPAQAGRAHRPRARGARHDPRAGAGARRRRAAGGPDRDPVGPGHPARQGGLRLPRPRRAGADDADRLRAAADRRPPDAPGARDQGRGRPRPRARADGDRARGRVPHRPLRARHRRRRLDRLGAVPPDRARRAEPPGPARPRRGQPVRDPARARSRTATR